MATSSSTMSWRSASKFIEVGKRSRKVIASKQINAYEKVLSYSALLLEFIVPNYCSVYRIL